MDTRVDEIADGIYRLSTLVPDIGPDGFTFNQFLVDADEPLLFHTGHRSMFPSVSRGDGHRVAGGATSVDHVRARRVGRVRFHERAAGCGPPGPGGPRGNGLHGFTERDGRPTPSGPGRRRGPGSRRQAGPPYRHAPRAPRLGGPGPVRGDHGTLLCGDLFTHLGNGPPVVTDDLVGQAAQAEDVFRASCLTPDTGPTMRRLADLAPSTLGLMHGSSFTGDGASQLLRLADEYDGRLAAPPPDPAARSRPG